MFWTNLIMIQDQINFLHNTGYYWWVLLGITVWHLMDQIRPKTENPLAISLVSICFYPFYFFLIMKIINMFRVRIPPPTCSAKKRDKNGHLFGFVPQTHFCLFGPLITICTSFRNTLLYGSLLYCMYIQVLYK